MNNQKEQKCKAINNTMEPNTVGALMEFVYGVNWIKTANTNFSNINSPIHDHLGSDDMLDKTGKKARLINRSIRIDMGYESETAFYRFIELIKSKKIWLLRIRNKDFTS